MDSRESVQPLRLTLLGGFTLLRNAEEIQLPLSAQRLVALIALREQPLSRAYLASLLWPECVPERALADLRTALWRANHGGSRVVATVGRRLCLQPRVQVDIRVLATFGRARAGAAMSQALEELSWFDLCLDLLPDWYDEWLVGDREGVRQLRLHALERMIDDLSLGGRHSEAIQAALAAVRLEPLRETAHAALIRAHLAEGNRSEALRQFSRFRSILEAELGIEPSESVRQLVSTLTVLSKSH